jgi:hypothetical protein
MKKEYIKLTEEDIEDLKNSNVGIANITKGDTEYIIWNEEEVDTCPYCKEKPADLDAFGLVTCNDCLNKHPEWRAKINEMERQEKYDLGYPMDDND